MKNLLLSLVIVTSFYMTGRSKLFIQGVSGKVYLKQGNYMPSPGRKPDEGRPVARTIWVYELTQRDQVVANGSLFNNIKTHIVAKTQSNQDGHYEIALQVGRYSVFVEEAGQLYANNFDGQGNINPVEVKKGSVTTLNLTVSNNTVN